MKTGVADYAGLGLRGGNVFSTGEVAVPGSTLAESGLAFWVHRVGPQLQPPIGGQPPSFPSPCCLETRDPSFNVL